MPRLSTSVRLSQAESWKFLQKHVTLWGTNQFYPIIIIVIAIKSGSGARSMVCGPLRPELGADDVR